MHIMHTMFIMHPTHALTHICTFAARTLANWVYRWFSWGVGGFTSGGQESGSVFCAAVWKVQAVSPTSSPYHYY